MVLNAGGMGGCGRRIACCQVWVVSRIVVRILPWPVCLRKEWFASVRAGTVKTKHGTGKRCSRACVLVCPWFHVSDGQEGGSAKATLARPKRILDSSPPNHQPCRASIMLLSSSAGCLLW